MRCQLGTLIVGGRADITVTLRSTFRRPATAVRRLEYTISAHADGEGESLLADNVLSEAVDAYACTQVGLRLRGTSRSDVLCAPVGTRARVL